jgi:hypothetical protein
MSPESVAAIACSFAQTVVTYSLTIVAPTPSRLTQLSDQFDHSPVCSICGCLRRRLRRFWCFRCDGSALVAFVFALIRPIDRTCLIVENLP